MSYYDEAVAIREGLEQIKVGGLGDAEKAAAALQLSQTVGALAICEALHALTAQAKELNAEFRAYRINGIGGVRL